MMQSFGVAFIVIAVSMATAVNAANHSGVSFCGGTVTPGDPTDLENQVGDMTLQAAVDQPASMTTCGKGYLLAKCGDHENANRIFDKCIAAGYVGAMIWKALQVENGNGVEQDLKVAADLLRQAAMSSDPAYGPLGRMHYATVLFEGRGVARDADEAMKGFRRAAAEGNAEAAEFLRTGYHTGARDGRGMGAGTPTAAALAPLRSASGSHAGSDSTGRPPAAAGAKPHAALNAIALVPGPEIQVKPRVVPRVEASPDAVVEGLILGPAQAAAITPASGVGGLVWLLIAAFLAGTLWQRPAHEIRVRAHLPRGKWA